MKRYSTGGWLLLSATALLVAACAHLPLQEREVIVPLSRLTEAISRRIGDERKVLEVFRVRVADPKLAADPNAQRLRADFALTLTHPFSSRPLTGRAAVSGVLGYDAESKHVVLHEPRIDRLDFDALPSALREVTARLATALGGELVGSFPLVSLRDKDLSTMGRDYRVTGFDVVEEGVRVRLRAVD
jgi:hypothetical protein